MGLHCQWTPTWPPGQHLLSLVALASPHLSLLHPLVVDHTPEQSGHLDIGLMQCLTQQKKNNQKNTTKKTTRKQQEKKPKEAAFPY